MFSDMAVVICIVKREIIAATQQQITGSIH